MDRNTQHRALVDATVERGVPGRPTQPQGKDANFTTPLFINVIISSHTSDAVRRDALIIGSC